jgi:adenylate cyclase class IV
MIEVEVRSPLLPNIAARLTPKLETMHLCEEKASQDVYYDTPQFDLLRHRQVVFARLREGKLLQFKFDEDSTSQERIACIEREFVISADSFPEKAHCLFHSFLPAWQTATTWEQVLMCNNLVELACIEKKRRAYIDGTLIITIDQVKGLGNFVEIEQRCQEGTNIREAEERVHAFLAEIGGTPLRAGYLEMWLYKHNAVAYQFVPSRFHIEKELLNFL